MATDVKKIVLAGADDHDLTQLGGYEAVGGYRALAKARAMTPKEVTDELMASELRGRGGAFFPTGRKWSFVPSKEQLPKPHYLVVNADESEPGSFKDNEILARVPHRFIEGCLITAHAIDCTHVFIYIRGEYSGPYAILVAALEQLHGRPELRGNVTIVVHRGAGAYICGEETALLESLEGKRGFPRIKPPFFPAVIGLYGQPTVVNNVETLSNVPWIVANGGRAFAALGKGRSTGTRLFALSGRVRRPGVYELEMVHNTFRDLIYDPALGGGTIDDVAIKAVIPGGASSPWFGPDLLDVPLGQDEVQEHGSMLGSGSVIVIGADDCAVRAAWRLTKFFQRESCGQCTPCREGAGWLERILRRLVTGGGRIEDIDLLLDVCDNIAPGLGWPPQQTTICPLGPSIPSPITSAISLCKDEFLAHVEHGGCPNG